MSKNFTLDDIREAAEKKYGSVFITVEDTEVELVNVLRLKKDKRDIIMNLAKDSEDDDNDIDATRDKLLEGLRAACRTKTQGDVLVEALGDDTALVAEVFAHYTKDTQAGEASPSQD